MKSADVATAEKINEKEDVPFGKMMPTSLFSVKIHRGTNINYETERKNIKNARSKRQ